MSSFGILYIVATPIGHLDDMTLRAIETLKKVDIIAAEDTRHSQKLLQHYQIQKPLVSLHEFNERARTQKILAELKNGKNIALISDAGTPTISDPGYHLVREARRENLEIISVPGACAAIAALSISGLPTDRFVFEGFLPVKTGARLKQLNELKNETRTMIFYEAPHRIKNLLTDLLSVFEKNRTVVLARELTKLFESVLSGPLEDVSRKMMEDQKEPCGEWVVLLQGAAEAITSTDEEIERILTILLSELPVKQAAAMASKITGRKKNELYEMALQLQPHADKS